MRKSTIIFSLVILLVGIFALSGCSKDVLIADDLRGIWRGELAQSYYDYRWKTHTTEYVEVEYEFYDNALSLRKGSGVEYSYDNRGRGHACGFDYEVRDRKIYLYFDDGADIVIPNYRLNDRIFSGDFCNMKTGEQVAHFSLVKVGEYYNDDIVWRSKSAKRKDVHALKSVSNKPLENVEAE